jgi:hypothetical protein
MDELLFSDATAAITPWLWLGVIAVSYGLGFLSCRWFTH